MTHKEIKIEHVFNQFGAFHRSWHSSGANETSAAQDTRESGNSLMKKQTSMLHKTEIPAQNSSLNLKTLTKFQASNIEQTKRFLLQL